MRNLGELTLNLSFYLYLVFYLPQLWRNFRCNDITNLSLGFHSLLFIGATADLFYGFGRIQQWQYRVISLTMFLCVLVQHVHFCWHARRVSRGKMYLTLLSLLVFVLLVLLFFVLAGRQHYFIGSALGWVERIAYWFYSVPQLIKNKERQDASSLSPYFLVLAVLTALCDSVSAWTLSWGPSSLYGAPLALLVHLILLYQWCNFRKTSQRQNSDTLQYT